MATQQQFVSQMLAQLRALDPSISGEVGTPERKIIEAVASAMAQTQVDIYATNGSFDMDSKFGSDIDKLISVFGYGRQTGTKSVGYVKFSRTEATTKDIIIPAGTQLVGPKPANGLYNTLFITTSSSTLAKNTTSVTAPVACITVGTDGNVAAETIDSWVGTPVFGVTSVINETPTYGGTDPESDNELKVRFKNTVFRNVAGTNDQYLALGMAAPGVSRANVLGPVSKYKEKIQVPLLDDSTAGKVYGNAGPSFTSAPATTGGIIPASTTYYYCITSVTEVGESVAGAVGSQLVGAGTSTNTVTLTWQTDSNAFSYKIYRSTSSTFSSGSLLLATVNASLLTTSSYTDVGLVTQPGFPPAYTGNKNEYTTSVSSNQYLKHFYTDLQSYILKDTANLNTFYSNGADFVINSPSKSVGDSYQATSGISPNVTFKISADAASRTILPGDTVIFEYSYLSSASRNDYDRKVLNCVDIFIDSPKETHVDSSIPIPYNTFDNVPNSPLYVDKYRRIKNSSQQPSVGNYFTPLFQQPVTDLPDTITVSYTSSTAGQDASTYTYTKGVHYWAIQDVTELRGTIRARNGIEWSSKIPAKAASDGSGNYGHYTGPVIGKPVSNQVTASSISVNQYAYDQNISDVQASVESYKQVTTDALIHQAKTRYFKPDLTVSYAQGADPATTNQYIKDNLDYYFKSLPFGSYIQLSDILQTAHNAPGVDNVDWTYNQTSLTNSENGTDWKLNSKTDLTYASKITETDVDGSNLATFVIEPYGANAIKAYFTLPSNSPYLKTSRPTPKYIISATNTSLTITLDNTVGISVGQVVTGTKLDSNQTYTVASIDSAAKTVTLQGGTVSGITTTIAGDLARLYFANSTSVQTYDKNGFTLSYQTGYGSYNTAGRTGTRPTSKTLTLEDWKDFSINSATGTTGENGLLLLFSDLWLSTIAGYFYVTQLNTDGTNIPGSIGVIPSYDQPMIFTQATGGGNAAFFPGGLYDFTGKFTITSNMLSNYNHNSDIELADDEIASLPPAITSADGIIDITPSMTIRQKTQNTWSH